MENTKYRVVGFTGYSNDAYAEEMRGREQMDSLIVVENLDGDGKYKSRIRTTSGKDLLELKTIQCECDDECCNLNDFENMCIGSSGNNEVGRVLTVMVNCYQLPKELNDVVNVLIEEVSRSLRREVKREVMCLRDGDKYIANVWVDGHGSYLVVYDEKSGEVEIEGRALVGKSFGSKVIYMDGRLLCIGSLENTIYDVKKATSEYLEKYPEYAEEFRKFVEEYAEENGYEIDCTDEVSINIKKGKREGYILFRNGEIIASTGVLLELSEAIYNKISEDGKLLVRMV